MMQCADNVDLTHYIYAPDEGIYPGTGEDITEKLITLLDKSNASQKGIYFPEGVYIFSENILMKSYNSLKGSINGTLFRGISAKGDAVMFGDDTYSNTVTCLSIENIIFDNIRVHFYGRKISISVNYNVFINTKTDTSVAQLTCSTTAYTIRGNVFMRGKGYSGVALSTYGNTVGLLVEQNFLGSVDDIQLASQSIDGNTQSMLATLPALRETGVIQFDNVQGDFVAGWYATLLKKGVFRKNFVSGSTAVYLYNPEIGQDDISRDHAIYIKQYDKAEVIQNYFSGWPGDDRASGQLKFRNAKGLVFAGNYLKNISLNARPYDNVDNQWLIMLDTFIFNNSISNGMISYWQNFANTPEKYIGVKHYLVFSNIFMHRNEDTVLISSFRDTLLPEAFLSCGNRFADTGNAVLTSGAMTDVSLAEMTALLPDYAFQYLNIAPIMYARMSRWSIYVSCPRALYVILPVQESGRSCLLSAP